MASSGNPFFFCCCQCVGFLCHFESKHLSLVAVCSGKKQFDQYSLVIYNPFMCLGGIESLWFVNNTRELIQHHQIIQLILCNISHIQREHLYEYFVLAVSQTHARDKKSQQNCHPNNSINTDKYVLYFNNKS